MKNNEKYKEGFISSRTRHSIANGESQINITNNINMLSPSSSNNSLKRKWTIRQGTEESCPKIIKMSEIQNKVKLIDEINCVLKFSKSNYEDKVSELHYLQSGSSLTVYHQDAVPIESLNDINNNEKVNKNYFLTEDLDESDTEFLESDEIVNRAKAEVNLLSRISYLKYNDLWSQKMLTRKPDPTKPVFHWDNMLKEMKWFYNNKNVEKQNKKIDARKITVAVCKFIKEKEAKLSRLSKEETVKAKKHCSVISKMIKDWWKQMEKIVLAKHKFRVDARRQEAMNTHLDKVLQTTEKYTEWLTEDLKAGASSGDNANDDDDPEFILKDQVQESDHDSEDCELNREEEEFDKDELDHLTQQNHKPLTDILSELPEEYLKTITGEGVKEDELIDEYIHEDVSEEDNEETLNEQEIYEESGDINQNNDDLKQPTKEEEIEGLTADADLSIDELLERYKGLYKLNEVDDLKNDNGDYDDNNENENSVESSESSKESTSSSEEGEEEDEINLKTVFPTEVEELAQDNKVSEFQNQFNEITEVALSTQPRGFTLESADIKVQIPFLLKHSLREYQHVGLNWLAAIYEKRLNGVLADEMGLGKTIQTIALLAYLACEKSIWGPHLIVVPTSVILNWEVELKKWCPSFKILTYFGSMRERKEKRKGWTKPNAFHVCITSYKLAIQDANSFKRKKWKYIILDEAQNIKNFKSQRWQTLLTFNSQRRLLLTGTPLQNNLMELWSLMHFLMPNIFQSHREFNEWFGNPLNGMVEGNSEYNEQLIIRLHKVLRPFILRRLKKDVEKQLPQKIEHVVMCPLSKRQRFLYDDFMSMTSTRETLKSGQFMSIIGILMQLRKVCNHPNLFEERPVISPFIQSADPLVFNYPQLLLINEVYENNMTNGKSVLPCGSYSLVEMAENLPKFVTERIKGLTPRPNLIEEIDVLQTKDWVDVYNTKYGGASEQSPFIPNDLNTYLDNTQASNMIEPPKPVYFGLDVRHKSENKRPDDNNNSFTTPSESLLPHYILTKRAKERRAQLKFMANANCQKCSQIPDLTPDLIDSVRFITKSMPNSKSSWSDSSNELVNGRSLEQILVSGLEIILRSLCLTPPVLSQGILLNTTSSLLKKSVHKSQKAYLDILVDIPPVSQQIHHNQMVRFPETRLIEYDCGKLQVMVQLLQRLKLGGHRCLIFTQMTRMLDVLEQFLSYHGYRYLRLDGTTKIEQRQMLMERFNKDDKIFAFILSTRSGGIGVNLTGADTVIFYDSDWNPTMDAQAQDRCHRIGQTRDVHIYRLISSMTVEENILKKANEKRCLSEMAIEGGQFNMSYFKGNTLTDIFANPSGLQAENNSDNNNEVTPSSSASPENLNPDNGDVESESIKLYKSKSGRTIRWKGDEKIVPIDTNKRVEEDVVLNESDLEAALEQAEEETDRQAAKMTKAEACAELMEFDESVPWDELNETQEDGEKTRLMEIDLHLENFNSQLAPIQRFGVCWLEDTLESSLDVELKYEESQIETNKQEWELEQIKALHENDEIMKDCEEDDMLYIYGNFDPAAAQKQELERLRQEEELERLRQREDELLKQEQERFIAEQQQLLIEAQKKQIAQKNNKLMIMNEINANNEGDKPINVNENSITSIKPSPAKQRKIIIPRLELPDENIVTSLITTDLSANNNITNNSFPSSLFGGSDRNISAVQKTVFQSSLSSTAKRRKLGRNTSARSNAFNPNTSTEFPNTRKVGRPRGSSSDESNDSLSNENYDPINSKLPTTSISQRSGHGKSTFISPKIVRTRNSNSQFSRRSSIDKEAPSSPLPSTSLNTPNIQSNPTENMLNFNKNKPTNYSFKIPVKNLNGEHKLFSAPKLLNKASPVFLVTRKIEDHLGNTYIQNLTYPIQQSSRYLDIVSNLTTNFNDQDSKNENNKCNLENSANNNNNSSNNSNGYITNNINYSFQ